MAKSDKIAGLILLALFSAGLFMAFSFPVQSSYFPKIICILGILLSILLVALAFRGDKEGESENTPVLSTKARKMLVVMTGLIILYALGITTLGFAVSTFLFMVVSGVILYPEKITKDNKRPLGLIVLSGLITAAAITVVFKMLLYVPLPSGILI